MKIKKCLAGGLIFLWLTLLLSSCSNVFYLNRPDDTTLEFWITEDVADVDFSSYSQQHGWLGATVYYGKGYAPVTDENGEEKAPDVFVRYKVSAYPDYADGGRYITEIVITDPAVTVYGMSISVDPQTFDDFFKGQDYEVSISDVASGTHHVAVRQGITFTLIDVKDGSRMMLITARVSNRDNMMF